MPHAFPGRSWQGPAPDVSMEAFLQAHPQWQAHYTANSEGHWLPPEGVKAFIVWARAQGYLDAWSAMFAYTQVRQDEDKRAREEGTG